MFSTKVPRLHLLHHNVSSACVNMTQKPAATRSIGSSFRSTSASWRCQRCGCSMKSTATGSFSTVSYTSANNATWRPHASKPISLSAIDDSDTGTAATASIASSGSSYLVDDLFQAYRRGELSPSTMVSVHGWVRSIRPTSGHGPGTQQAVRMNNQSMGTNRREQQHYRLQQITNGCSLTVTGTLTLIQRYQASQDRPEQIHPHSLNDLELQCASSLIHGSSPLTYPISKQRLTLEYLREYTHLRWRTNTLSAITRIRSISHHAFHEWFQQNHFWCVQTPIITPLDCEGGGEAFSITAPSDKPPSSLFFDRAAYLSVSGQLYAEMVASAMTRVYTFGPTFRAETSVTPRHLAEFWMLEPEVAFADLNDIMDLAEKLLKWVIVEVLKKLPDDMSFLDERVEAGLTTRLETITTSAFARVSYTDAIDILVQSGASFEFPVIWGESLHSEHEKYLAETHFKKPVFVTHYPRAIKPFYMKTDPASIQNKGKETVREAQHSRKADQQQDEQLFDSDYDFPGVGELIGGSQREDNYEALQSRMVAAELQISTYQWYLDLRKYGSVPHSGFGLGFERFLRWITGVTNVRDLIAVPRGPGSMHF